MRVVVLRGGWMSWYAGDRAGDEAPIGGGSYNAGNLGHERFNFKSIDGRLYGTFQSPGNGAAGLNLRRIDPSADKKGPLDGVLVVFIAKHPTEGGQRVVGWYRDAIGHSRRLPAFGNARANCGYQVECDAANAVLLPPESRTWLVPTGKGGMKRTHVRYAYTNGKLDMPSWLSEIVESINSYAGRNAMLLVDRQVEESVRITAEEELARRGTPGFQSDPQVRKLIEDHAMRAAIEHYTSRGWSVKDHHKNRPYDLLVEKDQQKLRVEVKGTAGDGSAVILTRGEVESAQAHPSALVIVRDIRVSDGEAHGGVVIVREPWRIDAEELVPLAYFYRPG